MNDYFDVSNSYTNIENMSTIKTFPSQKDWII